MNSFTFFLTYSNNKNDKLINTFKLLQYLDEHSHVLVVGYHVWRWKIYFHSLLILGIDAS